jgi:polysaccharide export outer membrane protein
MPTHVLVLLGAVTALAACPSPAVNYDYRSLPDPATIGYKVQAGDRIHIRVLRNEASTGTHVVRPDGYISVPLAGEVLARGKSIEELRTELVSRLNKYIQDANEMVSVSIEQVQGIRYSVIGEVQRAGFFESPRHVTLLEALANAGGLTAYAQTEAIYVLRRDGQNQLKVPVSYTRTVQDPGNRNFFLLAGDVVVVP